MRRHSDRSGVAMEPYDQASVLRTCRGFVAHRGLRVPCQDSISGLPSLCSRPCCRPLGMPRRKVVVAVMEVAATVVVITAVVMRAAISAVGGLVGGILPAPRILACGTGTP